MTTILILGSGPGVVAARGWSRGGFDKIVAINNAWQVRNDWDDLVFPWDFPNARLPPSPKGRLVTQEDFVPAQNAYGGFVYAGATMAFTAAYWALHEYRPAVMAFAGCNMHYPASGPTHFYGTGSPDPLRPDITLQSLEAKSARLMVLAAMQGCACVSLSPGPTRLVFPPATIEALPLEPLPFDPSAAQAALLTEKNLGYYVKSGRYWEDLTRFDAGALANLDARWLAACSLAQSLPQEGNTQGGADETRHIQHQWNQGTDRSFAALAEGGKS